MSETGGKVGLSEVRKRAWETRRAKYGPRGHAGSYSRGYFGGAMVALIVRLYAEGTLSEGQAARATGLDRITLRKMADATPSPSQEEG